MEKNEKDMGVVKFNEEQNSENDSPLLKYLLKKASESDGSNLAVNFTDIVEITIKRGDEIKEVIRL
ncbi:MAG: hypothetical protein QXO33_04775 [Nitrososphaeria archaeon]